MFSNGRFWETNDGPACVSEDSSVLDGAGKEASAEVETDIAERSIGAEELEEGG